MSDALGIVYRAVAGVLIHKAGLTQGKAHCGAVTFIQRFGSALNLNVHFHMLIPDGVYLKDTDSAAFRRLSPPTSAELQALVQRISERIGRQMERKGLLARDAESSYLALEPGGEEGALADLQGHSITYRIALGPHKGRKAFLLQSLAPRGKNARVSAWHKRTASRCTPESPPRQSSARSSSGCAATLRARRWRSSACRAPRRGPFATR